MPPVDSPPSPTDDGDDLEETSIAPGDGTILGVIGRVKPDRHFGWLHDLESDPGSESLPSRQILNDSNWSFAGSDVVSLASGEECRWA